MPSFTRARPAAPGVTLLVVLLALTVIAAGLLAFEAHEASRSHRVTAERALRDYASVAAWEFVAVARRQLDRRMADALAPVTSGRSTSPYEPLPDPAVLAPTAGPLFRCADAGADQQRTYFRVDLRTGEIAGSGGATAQRLAWLRDTVVSDARRRLTVESPFAAVLSPPVAEDEAIVLGMRYAPHGAPVAVYGFTTCERALTSPAFSDILARQRLLPSAVTGGASTEGLVAVSIRDAAGRELYRSRDSISGAFSGDAPVDGLDGVVARATLLPGAEERLLVGRPQRSRLPMIVVLLGMTVGLALVALVQLRREMELTRLRADFISGISHELRTPLAQILLFGETLHLGRTRSPGETRLAAETIVVEARRLMDMVDNVLQFARASRGRATVRPINLPLAPVVEDAAAGFAPLAASAGARINLRADPSIVAPVDGDAFRRVLLNILDNAVKYGPRGQTVSVELSRAGDRARLLVEDEGPGIAPADRERIWEPYVRLDGTSARGGSGIGLALVRELVRLHGGSAWVEPAASGGARFVVELPACPPADQPRDARRVARREAGVA